MRLDRQIVRLLAGMIIAALAYGLPSAAQAHSGHDHGQKRHTTSSSVPASTADIGKSSVPATLARSALSEIAATSERKDSASGFALEEATAIHVDADGTEIPSGCDGACCSGLSCCAAGLVQSSFLLPLRPVHCASLASMDVIASCGISPEAMRKPPRTLA